MEVLEEVDVYKPTPRTKLEFLKSPVIGSTEGIDRLQEEASGRSGYKHGPEHSVPGVASSKLECVGHEGLPVFRKVRDYPITMISRTLTSTWTVCGRELPRNFHRFVLCGKLLSLHSNSEGHECEFIGYLRRILCVCERQ